MTYNIHTLYQSWLSNPEPFKYGYKPTYESFLQCFSGEYNDAIDDGIEPDPICAWIMSNAPDELPMTT